MEFQNYEPTLGATANSIYDDLSRITINLVPHMASARQATCFNENCLPGGLKRVISPKLMAEKQRRDGASLPKMSMADARDIAASQERAQISRDAELRMFGLLPSQKEGKKEGGGKEEGKGKSREGGGGGGV